MTDPDAPRLRTARLGEIPLLLDVQRRASLIWEAYRDELTAHPEAITIPAEQVRRGAVRVIADEDDRPLGFSAVVDLGESVELDGLFVVPEEMRRGLGSRLVDDLVERAREAGARRIEVTANPGAVPFYERLGFREAGTTQTQFGPAPRFTLEL